MLYSEPVKHMIFGPGCSVEAEVLAQASSAWNITHVNISYVMLFPCCALLFGTPKAYIIYSFVHHIRH